VAGKPSRDGCPDDDLLPFEVVRSTGHDEPLACAANLLIARGAYERATSPYSRGVELRHAVRVIGRSR